MSEACLLSCTFVVVFYSKTNPLRMGDFPLCPVVINGSFLLSLNINWGKRWQGKNLGGVFKNMEHTTPQIARERVGVLILEMCLRKLKTVRRD
jgi:hypothetical protein